MSKLQKIKGIKPFKEHILAAILLIARRIRSTAYPQWFCVPQIPLIFTPDAFKILIVSNQQTESGLNQFKCKMANKRVFTLHEVALSIQSVISGRYTKAYWIEAEINKLNFYQHSGHCFPELVEKKDGKITTELRATLWKENYDRINQTFLSITKEPLKEGVKVLLQATVVYHELYGLSLNILDIDPNYALGVLAREKQETIQKLQKEGLFYLNKKLPFPLLPRRLALISVESSKGLADFTQVLDKNPWHYRILYTLFPALLQGDRASQSIINQLENIKKSLDSYDAVAIIRGGGGDVGLSCYNNYTLSKAISNFPLPVLTGIGHATNETVSEMVAFKSAITPSMLADFILQQFHLASQPLLDAELTLRRKAFDRMATEKEALDILKKQMKSACYNRLKFAQADLDNLHRQGVRASINVFRNEERKLNALDKQLLILNPFNTLKRGYSITYFQGIPLRNSSLVTQGDVLEIQLEAGRLKAIVSENNN